MVTLQADTTVFEVQRRGNSVQTLPHSRKIHFSRSYDAKELRDSLDGFPERVDDALIVEFGRLAGRSNNLNLSPRLSS